jgi:hypothetical protein
LRRSSKSERLSVESITLTTAFRLPDEVEQEFLAKAGDNLTALAWLVERDIDPAPILEHVGKIALIQYWSVWNPNTGRYEVSIRGYLASLMGAEVSALVVVAREGLEPPTPGL